MEWVFHFGYVLPLFLLSSLYILRIDKKGYEMAGMKREKSAAAFLGWTNLLLFFLSLLLLFIYHRFLW
ncbi:MAG: hypothetical protein IMW85_03115 [Thermicanus sp.]|nr:hypothetical protein [Thermicanus sp.]